MIDFITQYHLQITEVAVLIGLLAMTIHVKFKNQAKENRG